MRFTGRCDPSTSRIISSFSDAGYLILGRPHPRPCFFEKAQFQRLLSHNLLQVTDLSVVDVCRFDAIWYGFAVSRGPMALSSSYWALARTTQSYRAELAGDEAIDDWTLEARRLFGSPNVQISSITDAKNGLARVAVHKDNLMIGALFVSRAPVAVMREYLSSLPGTPTSEALAGRPAAEAPNPRSVLCSCVGVGINTIVSAIEDQGLISVEHIGEVLGAGTNCGSCRPEIAELLQRARMWEAAE